MKTLKDALKNIKQNPKEYIGAKSIERLKCFIDGYLICQMQDGICSYPEWPEKFMLYLQEKYDEKRCIGSMSIIRQITLSDKEAFDKYYELLDEFFIISGGNEENEFYEKNIGTDEN